MVTIRSTTTVQAPMDRCFMLAVSIDLQMAATGHKAIDGVTSGLIGPGDTVTWQGSSFGRKVTHQSLIEVWRPYSYFRDIMIEGAFASYEHEHHFAPLNDGTRIRDEIRFTTPRGMWGRLAERFFLREKIAMMLRQRNVLIKKAAESDRWHEFLDGQSKLDMRVFQAGSAIPQRPSHKVYAG
jgi:ligand-binding SRPBCC domain-containing protein